MGPSGLVKTTGLRVGLLLVGTKYFCGFGVRLLLRKTRGFAVLYPRAFPQKMTPE